MPDQSIEARRAELAALIEGRSDEEITRGVEERGVESVLDGIFQGMAEAFLPDKAAGQSAVVQYDVTVRGEPHTYQLKIGGGKCEVVKGRADPPRVTLTLSLPDFLRLVAGKLPPVEAFMTGKLKLQGDVMIATAMQVWFPQAG
jgi:putative sterol carrier protein